MFFVKKEKKGMPAENFDFAAEHMAVSMSLHLPDQVAKILAVYTKPFSLQFYNSTNSTAMENVYTVYMYTCTASCIHYIQDAES